MGFLLNEEKEWNDLEIKNEVKRLGNMTITVFDKKDGKHKIYVTP